MRCATILFVGLICAGTVLAHDSPIDHIDRVVQIYVAGERLHVHYRFRCEERQVLLQLHQMDKNGDGKISDEERDAYFSGVAQQLLKQLHVEFDGEPLLLTIDGPVHLAPDLSQTYDLSAPLVNLSVGTHTGRFSDDFSRTHPGPYRWSPRQFDRSGIEVNAVAAPGLEQMGPHPAMIVVRLVIIVHPGAATQPATQPSTQPAPQH